jgi:hypothetical protein
MIVLKRPRLSKNFTRSEVDVLERAGIRQAGQYYFHIPRQLRKVWGHSRPESRELCSFSRIAVPDGHRKSGGDQAARDA